MPPPTSNHLCDVRSGLDFTRYLKEVVDKDQPTGSAPGAHRDAIQLGYLPDIIARSADCAFCYLAVEALCLRWSKARTVRPKDLLQVKDPTGREIKCSICSFTSGYGRVDSHPLTKSPSVAYHIGLSTTRETNWYDCPVPLLLEAHIALLAEDAERIGQDAFGQGGLVQAGQVESAWVRGCLHKCETQHGSTCQPRSTEPIREFLVIDAEKMRIVGAPQLCRFLALSYCWGSARAFRLEKANFEMLQREGSLKTALDKLPRTIKDALQLCRDLGERYLWVDSVCIIQDDDDHRGIQISQVDRIYQSATLTIVCVHADAGLPGVQPGCRPNKQIVREVQSLEMAVPLPYMDEVADMSHWNTRAWTYQERCLSQRLLFLTETQAYFVCGEKIFCEDTIAEGPITGWHLSIVHSRPLRVPRGTYSFRPIYDGGRGFMKPYASHLRFYSRRRISYQSDILDAFRGVLNVINLMHNFKIWQGLPEIYPDAALLWITLTISKRREVAETDMHASPRPVFPSWSWSGWLGEVETPLSDDLGFTVAGFQPAVNWYLMNEDGEVIRLETESFVGGQYGDQPPEYFKEELRISNHMVLRQRLCVDNEPFSDEIDHLGVLGMYHCPHAQHPRLQHDVEHLPVA